jgi:hypothetical protein
VLTSTIVYNLSYNLLSVLSQGFTNVGHLLLYYVNQ